jgi:hypothetical protein
MKELAGPRCTCEEKVTNQPLNISTGVDIEQAPIV